LSRAIEQTREHHQNNATFQAFERVTLEQEGVEEAARALGIGVESVYKAQQNIEATLRWDCRAAEHALSGDLIGSSGGVVAARGAGCVGVSLMFFSKIQGDKVTRWQPRQMFPERR
jgi:hypothetical protein